MPKGLISGHAAVKLNLDPVIKAEQSGDLKTAVELCEQIVSTHNDDAEAHNQLGTLYFKQDKFELAIQCFERAISLRPAYPRALTNLGACHNERKRNRLAIECYEKALSMDLKLVDAYRNMGKAWGDLDEYEMAVWCYRTALKLRPSVDTSRALSRAYRHCGRYHRARDLLAKALIDAPDDVDLHFSMAMTEFHLGNVAEGLREYEWRFKMKDMRKHLHDLAAIFDRPVYTGQDLTDKTLLLHTEQGFGDNLQFARFVSLIRPKVKRLVMYCRPGLGRLFSRCLDIDEFSENINKLPAFDLQLPLLSVPLHFDPHFKLLKGFSPYLSAPDDIESPIERDPSRLNVGLVWGASDSGFDHRHKKVPLVTIDPLLHNKAVKWFSLQVGSDRKDLAIGNHAAQLIDLAPKLRSFDHTARAIEDLDLVITCDTSVAHMAGAMGKPVWVMLKKEPDWRWHADGERTEWYPSARLFRQYSHGEWSDVIRRLIHELDNLIEAR
ncbi:MAG: hypothetical protein DHS20C01_10950 [marine bacterium B5-7]|nr:MAG: hypothetical protein DHS20C01_10950 [marine bacterium B5-7]